MNLRHYMTQISSALHSITSHLVISSVSQMFSCCDMNGFVLTDSGCAQAYREKDGKFYFIQIEGDLCDGISLCVASIDVNKVDDETLWNTVGRFYHKDQEEFYKLPLHVKTEYLFESGLCDDCRIEYNCEEIEEVIADYMHFVQTFQVR